MSSREGVESDAKVGGVVQAKNPTQETSYDAAYFGMFAEYGFSYINRYATLRAWHVIETNIKQLENQITQNILYVLKNTNFQEIGIENKEKAIERMLFYMNVEGLVREATKEIKRKVAKEIDAATEEAREEYEQKTRFL